jgi:hypothetical protein
MQNMNKAKGRKHAQTSILLRIFVTGWTSHFNKPLQNTYVSHVNKTVHLTRAFGRREHLLFRLAKDVMMYFLLHIHEQN